MIKKVGGAILILGLLVGVSLFVQDDAGAAPYWSGSRSQCYGYTTGSYDCAIGYDWPEDGFGASATNGDVWYGGAWFDVGNGKEQAVNNFMNLLEWQYWRGGRYRTGAVFIYNTMMGHQPPGVTFDKVSFAALRERLMYFVQHNYGAIYYEPNYYRVDNTMAQRHLNDVTWYSDKGVSGAYVFYRGGRGINYREFYVLKADCANPLGNTPGIPAPPPPSWNLTASTTVSQPTARRGDVVKFSHNVHNVGPIPSSAGTWVEPWQTTTAGTRIGGGTQVRIGPVGAGASRIGATTTDFTIPQTAAIGGKYCFNTATGPRVSGNPAGNWFIEQAVACVTVVRSYDLTPTVNISSSTPVAIGGAIDFTFRVSNGPGKDITIPEDGVTYQVIEVTIPPGASVPMGPASGVNDSCRQYSFRTGAACRVVEAGTAPTGIAGNSSKPIVPTNVDARRANVPAGTRVGTRICRVLAITKWNESAPSGPARHSAVACALVAASPYVSIVGGSVWSGGSYTSPYTGTAGMKGQGGSIFGSTGEYGLFATGTISGFGSAGKFNSADLTFAKDPTLGEFTDSHKISDAVSYYRSGAEASPHGISNAVDLSTLQSPNGATRTYKSSTSPGASNVINIGATESIGPGKRLVIYAPYDKVIITSDIKYSTNGANSFKDVPWLVIVAKEIEVNGGVSRIDGNFYAIEGFVTCSEGPRNSSDRTNAIIQSITANPSSACYNKQLTINGTVSLLKQGAKPGLVLNRSFGGEREGQPAEIIRFRPESFLSTYEYNRDSTSSILTTVHETELPARY